MIVPDILCSTQTWAKNISHSCLQAEHVGPETAERCVKRKSARKTFLSFPSSLRVLILHPGEMTQVQKKKVFSGAVPKCQWVYSQAVIQKPLETRSGPNYLLLSICESTVARGPPSPPSFLSSSFFSPRNLAKQMRLP